MGVKPNSCAISTNQKHSELFKHQLYLNITSHHTMFMVFKNSHSMKPDGYCTADQLILEQFTLFQSLQCQDQCMPNIQLRLLLRNWILVQSQTLLDMKQWKEFKLLRVEFIWLEQKFTILTKLSKKLSDISFTGEVKFAL